MGRTFDPMNLEELEGLCSAAETRWNDKRMPNLGDEPQIQLMVKGYRHGATCRIVLGVMGKVLSPSEDGTIALVKVSHLRKAIANQKAKDV